MIERHSIVEALNAICAELDEVACEDIFKEIEFLRDVEDEARTRANALTTTCLRRLHTVHTNKKKK